MFCREMLMEDGLNVCGDGGVFESGEVVVHSACQVSSKKPSTKSTGEDNTNLPPHLARLSARSAQYVSVPIA